MSVLQGIKVLDLTRILAGPWSTMALADLGAEVWKIESPDGDDTRSWMPPAKAGISTYYLSANRNKQSLVVDMRNPEGRQLILDLAAQADVVVENFLPASLKRLGLDYETLAAVNPRLIHCSITGYGRNNPMENRPGYDFIIQAESGFMSITGEKDGEPMRLGVAFIDLVTGMNAVQGILAALYEREKSGLGQSVDIALSDSALHFLANVASGYLNTGKVPQRFGNAHPSIVPYQLFNTADGRKTAWVNDRRCSGEVLRALSETLVELHGQHDDRGLLNPRGHRALLDTAAGAETDLAAVRAAVELPVALKIGPCFSSLAHLADRLGNDRFGCSGFFDHDRVGAVISRCVGLGACAKGDDCGEGGNCKLVHAVSPLWQHCGINAPQMGRFP